MKMSDTVMTQTSCRLCLDNDDNLMNVFDVPDLDKIIYQCVYIKIVQSDPLPTGVCFKCIGELQNWSKFKKTCDESQKTLLKHCKKLTMPPSITIQNIMNDSIEVDLSVFDHESLLDNLETSTNQSIVSFLPCHSTPLPEYITQNSIASQLFPSNDKEDQFKPIKREMEVVEESSCDVSQEAEHLNGTSQSYVDNLNKEETINNKSQDETRLCSKIVFKKPLYVKSIERCYQGLEQNKERFPLKNRNYKCDPCGKQFTTFRSILFHDQLEHKSILESRGVTCNECAQVFLDKTRLETHILMQHSTRSLDYQCTICSKCYVSQQSLTTHMTSHSDKNKCEKCDKRFTSASLLSVHIDRFHRKVKHHSCNICNKKFYTRAEVNRHQRTVHLKVKSFRCFECDLEFSNRSALDCHTRSVHTLVKKIICDQCGEGFKTSSQRWNHFRKMHDEYVTLFSCPLCEEMFTTKHGYRIHVQIHRPREEIFCFYCNLPFACKRNLIQHIARIHTKSNKTCDICGRVYLSRHICLGMKRKIVKDWAKSRRNKYSVAQSQNREQTPSCGTESVEENNPKNDGKTWECEQCDKIYSKKFNLRRHMMRNHKKPKIDDKVDSFATFAVKKPKLSDNVDIQEEIINSMQSHVLENVKKERPILFDIKEPRVDTVEPRVDTPEPQANTIESQVDIPEFRVDTQEPRVDAPEPRVNNTQEPRVVEIINTTGSPLIQLFTDS